MERTAQSGIDFVHFSGMSGELYFIEVVGPGAALFDFDNDGDLDIYITQGHMLGEDKTLEDAVFPPESPLTDRLYRNELNETGELSFVDVTETSGIDAPGYGMGVAAGDYDNDGWVDLYVSNYGDNQLWHNNGDGTFSDTTATAGVNDPHWSSSAAFFDFDRDGWLDLYLANYVHYLVGGGRKCWNFALGLQNYCGPQSYTGVHDRLFRNRGDGTFEDVSDSAGIASELSSGLGVVTADFNGDGWIDIYVANDLRPNNLWMNQGDGTFEDMGMQSGSAVNLRGGAEASMGIDAGDLDNDGDEDLFMTHLVQETNTIYINNGNALFMDRSSASGLGGPSLAMTGFGAGMLDYDNDGWLDILAVNGAVTILETLYDPSDPFPLGLPDQLFRNLGDGKFADVSEEAGDLARFKDVGRGLALGDLDNDGDIDALVLNNAGPARLFINQVGSKQPWAGLRLLTADGRRDAYGATVRLERETGPALWRRARSDASFLSANDPRVIFGLAEDEQITGIEVRWPDGTREKWPAPAPNRYNTLVQGAGYLDD